mgnify:CR=1 FL=1
MLSAKARAAGTAPKNNRQVELYRGGSLTSREILQQEIGELLFSLEFPVGQEIRQLGWLLFERQLRRYVGLRVPPKWLSEPLQSTISRQGMSG